jgi:hypothetical protein
MARNKRRIAALFRLVLREFAGALPSWIVHRVEAKASLREKARNKTSDVERLRKRDIRLNRRETVGIDSGRLLFAEVARLQFT